MSGEIERRPLLNRRPLGDPLAAHFGAMIGGREDRTGLWGAPATAWRFSAETRRFGVRRGITSWLARRPVTLGYPEGDHQHQRLEHSVPVPVGQASQGALASPTETPQVRDTAADPHRNPTDETAHSGTLVMRVKGTENSRSAASMRVSWAVGAFSR